MPMWLQLVACGLVLHASCAQPQLTFEDYYLSGKIAYTEKDWQQCIAFMRRVVEDFRYLEDELLFCRKKCSQQIELPEAAFFSQYYYEAEKALCFLRCQRERLTEVHPGIKKMSTYYDIKERKHFEYLHICYWNAGELQKAVGAAYTFVVVNPGKNDVLNALKYYMKLKEFQEEWLVDELALKHEKHFISGVIAYSDEDWNRCTHDLESAIEKIYEEELICRLQCEDKIDWSGVEGNPEATVVITSIRASISRCRNSCLNRLGVINGHNVGNPLSAAYEYLHVCYFKYSVMRGADAMKAVASYLLFDDNPTMHRNKNFYLKHFKKPDLFIPDTVREPICCSIFQTLAEFHRAREIEKKFLEFVGTRIRYENNEFPAETADDRKRLSMEIWQNDDFDYARAESFLLPEECRVLRAPIQSQATKLLLKELLERAKGLFPTAKEATASCGPAREADCERSYVVSVDLDRCSEWLGRQFSGCALIVCA